MVIADETEATFWLTHISYYRLSAYWLFFEYPKGTAGSRFRPETTFEAVTALYDFDRNLRRIVMRGTEHIEVALRGSWAYQLGQLGDGHTYLDSGLYESRKEFHQNLGKLTANVGTSSTTYIKHYRDTYSRPAIPPAWMVAEMMTFGELSRWYSNLKDRSLRNRIARPIGLPETVLVPFVRNLTDVRNVCAHHGRLWNRGFLQPPKLPQKPAELNASLDLGATQAPARLYNSLAIIGYIIGIIAPKSQWRKDLVQLIQTHPTGDIAAMGFPADWTARPLWM